MSYELKCVIKRHIRYLILSAFAERCAYGKDVGLVGATFVRD